MTEIIKTDNINCWSDLDQPEFKSCKSNHSGKWSVIYYVPIKKLAINIYNSYGWLSSMLYFLKYTLHKHIQIRAAVMQSFRTGKINQQGKTQNSRSILSLKERIRSGI